MHLRKLRKNISASRLDNIESPLSRRQGSRHLSESYLLRLSMSHAQPDAPKPVTPIVPMASPVKGKVSNSKSLVVDTPVVVGKGRMSMEKLRQSYDAVVLGRGGSAIPMMSESAFPWLGRFLLCLVGHMHFAVGLPSRIFCFLSYAVLPLVATGLLAFATATTSGITSKWSFTMASTLGHLNRGCCSGMFFQLRPFFLVWICSCFLFAASILFVLSWSVPTKGAMQISSMLLKGQGTITVSYHNIPAKS